MGETSWPGFCLKAVPRARMFGRVSPFPYRFSCETPSTALRKSAR